MPEMDDDTKNAMKQGEQRLRARQEAGELTLEEQKIVNAYDVLCLQVSMDALRALLTKLGFGVIPPEDRRLVVLEEDKSSVTTDFVKQLGPRIMRAQAGWRYATRKDAEADGWELLRATGWWHHPHAEARKGDLLYAAE